MSIVEYLSQPLWQRLGLTLVHFLWQGLAVAVLAGAFVRVFRLKHGNARYGAYLLAFTGMMICPVVTFTVIDIDISANIEPVTVAESAEVIESSPYTALPEGAILPDAATTRPAIQTLADSIPLGQRISDWLNVSMPWILVIWMAGVVVLSLRLLMGFVGVYRWRHHLEPLPESLTQRIVSLSEVLGMRGFSRVFISPTVLQAMAVGYLRPMVLLPAAMVTQMPPEMLEAVIAHELAHIRRFDLWVNLVQRVTETLLFYHPAVWWLSICLRRERELCCDELAVKATGERITYASTLESVGRARFMAKQPVLAAGLGRDNKPTLGRVRHILGLKPAQRNCPFWLAGVITVLFLAALVIPTTLALTSRTNEQADIQEKKDQKELSKFKKTLPNGVTVELIGMCEYPSVGKQWWRPDGSLLVNPPYDESDIDILSIIDPNAIPIEFAFRLSGNLVEPAWEAKVKGEEQAFVWWTGRRSKDGEFLTDIKSIGMFVKSDQRTLDLRLGFSLADGPYEWVDFNNISVKPNLKPDVQVEGEGGWGEAVEGVHCRLRAKGATTAKRVTLLADARNDGPGTYRGTRSTHGCWLKVDGKWYGRVQTREHVAPMLLKAGDRQLAFTQIRLSSEKSPLWRGGFITRNGQVPSLGAREIHQSEPLELSPGRHTVRLAFPASRKAYAYSNAVEIEILPAEEKPVVQVEGEGGWGEAVEGVQCRLRADKMVWKKGEVPMFTADVRNDGKRNLVLPESPDYCLLQFDEQWFLITRYEPGKEVAKGTRLLDFGSGEKQKDIVIKLSDKWETMLPSELELGASLRSASIIVGSGLRSRLRLTPGKHTIRVSFILDLSHRGVGINPPEPVQVVSNPVKIEILPEQKPDMQVEGEGGRGEAVEGVQLDVPGFCVCRGERCTKVPEELRS